jgi:hypothetical protein
MWLRQGIPLVGLVLLVACGGISRPVDAVATQAAPLAAVGGTAVAAGGQLAATAQAAATQAAPAAATAASAAQSAIGTAQAAATQVAPVLPTAATAAAGAVATARAMLTQAPINLPALGTPIPVPNVGAGGPVEIVGLQVGFPDTVVTIRNTSSVPIEIGDWTLRVGEGSARLPAGVRVPPGGVVAVHTAAGASGGGDVYLGEAAGLLVANLRPGARVALVDDQGKTVAEIALP